MIMKRYGDEIHEIVISPNRPFNIRIEIPENKRQYCCPESDARIRQMIDGMDDRERMIVLDELGIIYRSRAEKKAP